MNPIMLNKLRERWIINSPVVYRYMDNEFIERFFKYGELRLTSYQKFRNDNTDEIRGDVQEGINEYRIWNKNRDHHFTLQRRTGDNNFIFCTSLKYDEDLMSQTNFECDGCFKINNTLGFGLEIATKIKEFQYGLEGPVKYTDTGQIDINCEDYNLEDIPKNPTPEEMIKLQQAFHEISVRDTSLFFSKKSLYQTQLEYRFIWNYGIPGQLVKMYEHITIQVPEAVKFCEWITKPK